MGRMGHPLRSCPYQLATAVLVLSLALLGAARGDGRACHQSIKVKPCPSASDAEPPACGAPMVPAEPASLESAERLQTVKSGLQSCACQLVGVDHCTRKVRKKEHAEKTALRLSRKDAIRVSATVGVAVAIGSREQDFAIPYSRRLSQLAGAAVYSDLASGEAAQRSDFALQSYLLEQGLSHCKELNRLVGSSAELSGGTSAKKDRPADVQSVAQELLCSLRLSGDLWRHGVFLRWPGCRCEYAPYGKDSTESGVVVGDACISTPYPNDPFFDRQIDERMPGAFHDFISSLDARVAPLKVRRLGIIGCGMTRLETGYAVKQLARSRSPSMKRSHISAHAQGTACDLESVTFYDPQDCGIELTFTMDGNVSPNYAKSLFKYLQKTHRIKTARDITRCGVIVRKGVDAVYRTLEGELSAARPSAKPWSKKFTPEHQFQLKMGVLIRNALIDAGFVVLDPVINTSHRYHFHAELPSRDETHEGLKARDPAVRSVVERIYRRMAGAEKPARRSCAKRLR